MAFAAGGVLLVLLTVLLVNLVSGELPSVVGELNSTKDAWVAR
jgi:hypothetical protein